MNESIICFMKGFLLWLLFMIVNIVGIVSTVMVVRGFSRRDGQLIIIGGLLGLLSLYLSVKFVGMLF